MPGPHKTSFIAAVVSSLIGFGGLEAMADNQAAGVDPRPDAAGYQVRLERNVLIPMRDGIRLAADVLRPDADGRFPVVVEYIPYRKDDVSRGGLDAHDSLAQRGFVSVRLDVRGTGGSEGVNTDEYMLQEQYDGYDAIEWLAKQPWCNGNVGMFGTSYGGFTAVQVAMHRPPHLKAIIPMYATDDRYTDDCHYTPGGNMRMYYDVGTYGGSMVAMNALPPYPELAGPNWAEMWKQRLEKNEPYLLKWMHQQLDGDYWRVASLRPQYERIACPVFLIAGWHDGYVNAMLRMYERLKAPKKILIGPWVHQRPNVSVPGPRIDHFHEMARFFGHWLRGEETGIMQEPPVTVYMQEYAAPERTRDVLPGHWRNETGFPIAGAREGTFYLSPGGRLATSTIRGREPDAQGVGLGGDYDEFTYHPTVGLANAYWSAGGISFYLAEDQRSDEAYSLVYTSKPLERPMHLLGWPRVVLYGSASAEVATFVAKLCDVAPDGASALISDGSLNATRRRSLTEPTPLTPSKVEELEIPMPPTGWVVPAGHRLRISISGADFPNLWPTPYPAKQRVYHTAVQPSRISLPVVEGSTLPAPQFLPPPALRPFVKSFGQPPLQQVMHDQITGAVTVVNRGTGSMILADNMGTFTGEHSFRCTANAKDPAQASIVGTHRYTIEREDGVIEVRAESSIRATRDAFHILIDLNVTRNGRPFFQRTWTVSEPRRLL